MTAKEMMGAIAFTTEGRNKTLDNGIELLMIKFAKMKVKEALVLSAINASLTWDNKIDKGSILNAYDLNSIK